MFERFSSGKDTGPRNEAWHQDMLFRLSEEIRHLKTQVSETRNSLEDSYSDVGLKSLSQYFQQISSRFIRYSQQRSEDYYYVIRKSEGRIKSAQSVINSSLATAKLFEKYARKPNTYSQVDSQSKIDYLIAALENLKLYCQ